MQESFRKRPIGVFDSGVGGLTVVREILEQLPVESIIYIGDTARVPYGPRGDRIVQRFGLELANFLLKRNVKVLIIACNTISALAATEIRKRSRVPVLDAIEPAVRLACTKTLSNRIGVVGTDGTVGSGAYERVLRRRDPEVKVFLKACPLFVPIAEEGLGEHPIAELAAEGYLEDLKGRGIDTLILGCTHYPLLKEAIGRVVGPEMVLVDSAAPLAEELKALLGKGELLAPPQVAKHSFFVTDASYKFLKTARKFLGREIDITEVRIG